MAGVSDELFLEGCDVAELEVVPNISPVAKATYVSTSSGSRNSTITFKGTNSTDPNGDELSYSWSLNGQTRSGDYASFSVPTPVVGSKKYTVTMTATDGDKSSSTTASVTVYPYCYSCNGQEIP